MRRCCIVTVSVVVLSVVSLAHEAAATPPPLLPSMPPLIEVIDQVVAPPSLPVIAESPPNAELPSSGMLPTRELLAAVMPDPSGDAFFDAWPTDIYTHTNGRLLEWRDVTASAQVLVGVPSTATQLKFRSTDALGRPMFGTATVVEPNQPWQGSGQRPIVVNNLPIDALGARCTPSYSLAHGLSLHTNVTDFVPPTTLLALARGYAVLQPDHQGPRMAYAEPYVAGHVILDSIRAMEQLPSGRQLGGPVAMVGYSGGAIATHGAVKLIDGYAPELKDRIVGAALGGVPADFEMLSRSMNANLASGLFLAATFGVGRERPEVLSILNHLGQQLVVSPLKDQCTAALAALGVGMVSAETLANIPGALTSPVARRLYEATKMAGIAAGAPLFIYNGKQEFWIPAEGAYNLYREQCALGVRAVYREVFGEHVIGAVTGYPESLQWLDERLRGVPAHTEC